MSPSHWSRSRMSPSLMNRTRTSPNRSSPTYPSRSNPTNRSHWSPSPNCSSPSRSCRRAALVAVVRVLQRRGGGFTDLGQLAR